MADIKGKTSDGFEYSFPEERADDMELLELIELMDAGDLTPLPKILTHMLGADQKKALYEFYRKIDGRVSISRMTEVMMEIFNGSPATKNSESSPAMSEQTNQH